MRRRDFLRTAGLLPAAAAVAQTRRRPNIIVIVADDMGHADAGFTGCRDILTPHLDTLAREGVKCTQGYVSHPFCSPTRAGLMTGRYQQRFGHENNPRYDPRDETAGLPTDQTTLADALRRAGYSTGMTGKWHLGAAPRFHPLKRGFQEMFGFIGGGHDYFRANGEQETREYFIPFERNGKPVQETEYLTDAISREAADSVRRRAGGPFFLYVAYNAPHTPLQAPEASLDRFAHIADQKRRAYAAMLTAVDNGVGRIRAAIEEKGIERQTLIFFFSDNGGPAAINGSSNHPWRGVKGQLWEGGIRVPFVAHWPGTLPAGAVYEQPVISLDVFPTAVAAAGGAPAKGLDGVNLLPYWTGAKKGSPHQRLFWRTGGGSGFAVREGRYKLVKQGEEAPKLYDLESDPTESQDLAGSKPEMQKRLLAAYRGWSAELMPPLFESPRPAARPKA